MDQKKGISLIHFFWFFVQAQIGAGLFTLPYIVFQQALTDGWISVLIAGLISQVMIVILWSVSNNYPNLTFYEFQKHILGNKIGKSVIFLYSLYFIVITITLLVFFKTLIDAWVLPHTPDVVKLILFTIPALYLLNSPIKIIASFMTITAPILFLAPICAAFAFSDSEPLYLLPLLETEWGGIWKGALSSSFAMQGFLILPIIYPFVSGTSKEKLLTATYANIFVTTFYTFIVVSCYIYFSPGQFEVLPEPFLYMIKTISFTLFERVDLIFLAFWSIIVLSTLTILLYSASTGLEIIFNRSNTRLFSILIGCIVISLSMIPQNLLSIRRIFHYNEYAGILFAIFIPIFLFTYDRLVKGTPFIKIKRP
ncbi:GerAB/ArcD/ProY family transporter [Alkalicoccobacillus plakortidis]|uniref:Spore germination protein n=1 Tax=Alkalicoccobacillus plakortidis TaxID=444060 RepID=A0ABT0XNJ5_9BACI|nr:endospore germination permease [Alkalicoccobacillus plakortidis]MCM2677478.1 spore germination protein [Alkalicoccobacillus plakortidis]